MPRHFNSNQHGTRRVTALLMLAAADRRRLLVSLRHLQQRVAVLVARARDDPVDGQQQDAVIRAQREHGGVDLGVSEELLEGTGSFTHAGLGDLLVLAGVLSAAAYTIVARGMGDETDPLTMTACQFTTATILILPAVAFVWALHVETPPSHVAARFWVAAIFTGVIGYAASFLLYNYAIARVRAGSASIIVNLVPVFGLASAVFWLGDSLTVARVLGAILIGLSVTIFIAAELSETGGAARPANVTPSNA
jgi:uncharacterized membrane protein